MSHAPHDSGPHDKHFYDSFLVVLGILVAVSAVLIFVSRVIASATQTQYVRDDSKVRQATAERLAPVGRVAISGADNSALEPPKETNAAVATQEMNGEQAFTTACTACHGPGIAGAPKHGDKAAWAPRIAQGTATLYEHALKGFQGKAGFMPAKGGRTDLSDKSVTNAVDYMIKAAK
jgi:cytochrome c5